jgi:PhnB protein
MTTISPYLIFNGRCSEAMTFYKTCFGGELNMQRVWESPMADQWPEAVQDHILHASLVKDQLVLLASDMGAAGVLKNGETIMLSVKCNDEDEIKIFFANLSVDGKVIHPLHHFFDGIIGSLIDKFGMSWVLKC